MNHLIEILHGTACKMLSTVPLNIGSLLATDIMIFIDPVGHILRPQVWGQVCRWTQLEHVHMWTHPCACMCNS